LQRQIVLGELRVGESFVPGETPVHLDLVLEAINDGITVTGTVRAPYRAGCRRCLQPISGDLEAEVLEIFERRAVEGETYPLTGDVIDLDQLVRDNILLSLPLAPLCGDDCAGPAPELFPTRPADDGEQQESDTAGSAAAASGTGSSGDPGPAAEETPIDPRWAALRQLKLD
jgi:uncharacterized protein